MNWIGRQGLQLLETLMHTEHEVCTEEESLFEILNDMLTLQYNLTIKLLQFSKPVRQHNESKEEWMGRFRIAAIEWAE